MGGGWVLEVDIKGFFDSIPHGQLREVLQKRVNDGRMTFFWRRLLEETASSPTSA